ncbi:MAG: class I SAM-dependent rRNA methyltransferase [Candidatus Omnitrophota bacterium]
MSGYPRVTLNKIPGNFSRFGHPWIYRSQIKSAESAVSPGDLVSVYSEKNNFIGVGYHNKASEITIRLLTRKPEVIDKGFFAAKIMKAAEFRKRVVSGSNACRLVSSEGDDLPGLIVDQYGEVAVVQFLTLGMDRLRPLVLEALEAAVPSRGVYERSDSSSRKIEGLPEKVGWIRRDCGDEVTIQEGDIRYAIHFGAGHKTGMYLDQRENRLFIAGLGVKGEAIDAFCYEGGFGLHLAKAGCRVLGIDSQEDVIRRAEAQRELNGITPEALQFKVANVFDQLKMFEKEKRKFDLVILDPPSFVKKKAALEGALSGYKEIILRSMKILNEDGKLAVFSCSYHVDENLLMQASLSAASDVRRTLRVLKFLKQSADHPINPFIPETYYLKGFLFQVSSL